VRKNYGEVISPEPPQTQVRINQPVISAVSPQHHKQPVLQQEKRPAVVNAAEQQEMQRPVPEPPQSPPVHQQESMPADADAGLFEHGMSQFKAKDYKAAYKTFEQVIAGHPGDDQSAKTLYFMGECLFNMGEYDLAILDYQKVISNYSSNPHSSAALLRQGMSFEKLTDHETAKIIYAKLVADYPNSREAGVARQRMENL
jgi:tol-pal system protein YbgF